MFCISEGLEEQTSGCSIFRRLMVTKRDVWSCYPENVRLKPRAVVQVVMEQWYKGSALFDNCQLVLESLCIFSQTLTICSYCKNR